MNILIVDDDQTNRKVLRVNLEAEGHTTIEAVDGLEALEVLKRESMDAIVSDVLMPRMDGYRLCYEVKRRKDLWHLPFIVYSSTYNSPADEKVARDFGADDFIKKPGGIKEIITALQNKTSQATSQTTAPSIPSADSMAELAVMRDYSQLLVRKLEEKNTDLEQTREKLIASNQELMSRSEALERTTEELRQANDVIETRVQQRTAELKAANKELESFSYSVSHDLRAPLRAVDGFASMLMNHSGATLDETGRRYLRQIGDAATRMSQLIEAMLDLAKFSRKELARRRIDLSALTAEILKRFQQADPNRKAELSIAPDLRVDGDAALTRVALENLLDNAWKYTARREVARIAFGVERRNGRTEFFVRDNGAGFDMAYSDKLFGVFQRLHSEADFPGIGVGLATVRRIIERHGGYIRAEAQVDQGATFYFTFETEPPSK
jgi:signal transduction histidine kinase